MMELHSAALTYFLHEFAESSKSRSLSPSNLNELRKDFCSPATHVFSPGSAGMGEYQDEPYRIETSLSR